jgi:hypothetical protein
MRVPTSKTKELRLFGLTILISLLNAMYWSSEMVGYRLSDGEPRFLTLPSTSSLLSSPAFTYPAASAKKLPNAPWTIFYNAYLPLENTTEASAIIEEQLQQINNSHGATRPGLAPVKINLLTIGDPIGAEKVRAYCSTETNLDCEHLQHHEDGSFEDVTLSRLYDFCSNQETDDNKLDPSTSPHDPIVVYLHSKGTYHPSERNDHWRRYMTDAAMSQECLEFQDQHGREIAPTTNISSTHNTQCNVCGFLFHPIWTPFFPGNIWSAKCSYIRKLMHPQVFKNQSESTADKAVALMREGRFTMNLLSPFLEVGGYLGRERFADEHWVGSHPSLVPCDLAPRPYLMKWVHPRLRNSFRAPPLEWSVAPRHGINEDWLFLQGLQKKYRLVADPDWRHREFFLLPGALWKWITWYDKVPPASSYVWKWFPDGLEWLGRVETLGTQGLLQFLTEDTFLYPSDEASSVNPFQIVEKDDKEGSSRTFFFHIQIPKQLADEKSFRGVVLRRLESIGEQSPGATVFFNTVGESGILDVEEMKNFCREKFHLDCVHMEHLDAGMDLVTLNRVHEFCMSHNTSRVGFVRTTGWPELSAAFASQERLEQTRVVANDQCWTNTDCDVCSLKTNSKSGNISPKIQRIVISSPSVTHGEVNKETHGDKSSRNGLKRRAKQAQKGRSPLMWTASCAYINDLIHPNEFASRLSEDRWKDSQVSGERWIFNSTSITHCQVHTKVTAGQAPISKK